MKTTLRDGQRSTGLPDNALARQAIENIAKIDKEAQQKKMEQLDGLRSAKSNIQERLNELAHQMDQIDKAIGAVTGQPVIAKERKARKSWEGERERVGRWLEGRRGQKFAAGDLIREFPELDGQVMSIFLRPLIDAGKVKTDTHEGIRRTKYFVQDGSD